MPQRRPLTGLGLPVTAADRRRCTSDDVAGDGAKATFLRTEGNHTFARTESSLKVCAARTEAIKGIGTGY